MKNVLAAVAAADAVMAAAVAVDAAATVVAADAVDMAAVIAVETVAATAVEIAADMTAGKREAETKKKSKRAGSAEGVSGLSFEGRIADHF